MRERAAEMNGVVSRSEEMTRQREEMRLQVIELNAMLENARREIKEIGAQLAEARLQLKLAGKAPMATTPSRPAIPVDSFVAKEVAPVAPPAPKMSPIEALQLAFQRWNEQPEDQHAAWDLVREAAAYTGSCQAGGELTLQRLSSRMAGVLEVVVEDPSAATPRLRRLIERVVDTLAQLETVNGLDAHVRLTGARIYLVDDDAELCETSSELLTAAGFIVDSTQHPSAAIAHLAENSYDLILLDVRLPELDGFELCGYIRGMDLHACTPIVFVTGGEMLDASAGGPEFVAKPFAPGELVLRAMMAVLRSQVEMV